MIMTEEELHEERKALLQQIIYAYDHQTIPFAGLARLMSESGIIDSDEFLGFDFSQNELDTLNVVFAASKNINVKTEWSLFPAKLLEREKLLADAKKIVCGERNKQYGSIEDNFGLIANLWTVYTGVEIEARDVANMMILLKIARNNQKLHRDNWVDIAGYAACGAECDRSVN